MKFSVQEEYGLRCLLRIAKFSRIGKALTIPEISQVEGLSQHNVAKILRTLRIGGFLEASRGQVGGYTLAKTPNKIILSEVLECLGGKLFEEEEFCSGPDFCGNLLKDPVAEFPCRLLLVHPLFLCISGNLN